MENFIFCAVFLFELLYSAKGYAGVFEKEYSKHSGHSYRKVQGGVFFHSHSKVRNAKLLNIYVQYPDTQTYVAQLPSTTTFLYHIFEETFYNLSIIRM